RLVQGSPTGPLVYHDKGIMATVGRRSAVVQLPHGVRVRGTLAWLAWLGLHLVTLLGGRNRLSALINLSWRYVSWGHGGGVIVGDDPPPGPGPGRSGGGAADPRHPRTAGPAGAYYEPFPLKIPGPPPHGGAAGCPCWAGSAPPMRARSRPPSAAAWNTCAPGCRGRPPRRPIPRPSGSGSPRPTRCGWQAPTTSTRCSPPRKACWSGRSGCT